MAPRRFSQSLPPATAESCALIRVMPAVATELEAPKILAVPVAGVSAARLIALFWEVNGQRHTLHRTVAETALTDCCGHSPSKRST